MRSLLKIEPGIVVLLILVTAFWAPAIFEHKTIIHGDFAGHGLPLMDVQSRALRDFGTLLWEDKTYGGHPLFAEGQGGFAHPVNMLFAWLVAPLFGVVAAENLFHWFYMTFGGVGIFLLCRQLGLGPWAACFGAIAGVFSAYNLNQQQNETVSAAAAWVSWCIWAFGRWLDRPSLGSAALLGLMLTLEFLSGYPQTLDGVLLYGLMMLAVRVLDPGKRANWGRNGRVLIGTGAAAAVIALGLSAVQLMPEMELVRYSHRSGGTAITIQLPLEAFMRGFLFTHWEDAGFSYFPIIGSILICMLATLTLVIRTTNAVRGHIAGTLLLIILGMGQATAMFRFIYDHNLLPQLHFYRLVLIYLNDANVTIAVLAAVGVDAVSRWAPAIERRRRNLDAPPTWALVFFMLLWAWTLYAFRLAGTPIVQYGVTLASIVAIAAFVPLNASRWLPLCLTLLLVVEIAATRLRIFHFADVALLNKPGSVAAIQAEPDWRDYKIYSDNGAGPYTFMAPNAPGLEGAFRRASPAMAGLANLRWDLSSIDGALALGLARRWMIGPRLKDEVYGRVDQPPGARLIDLLSIRWIAFDEPAWAPAVRTLWHDGPGALWIQQDDAAKPRFQIYSGCRRAASSDEALDILTKLNKPALVIEDRGATDPCGTGLTEDIAADAPLRNFTVLKARSTRYRFDVSVNRPAWFFVADANYPGWKAYLDGVEVPIYSAQILGKAVSLPAGRHELQLKFRPMSFYIGLLISLLTAVSAAAVLIRARWVAKTL
jgi:hypothetical protein